MMHRHYDARRCFGLTGQVTPIHSPALVELVGRVPGAPPEYRRAPSPRRPVAGRELHASRGAKDGATGGGHRASGVIPLGFPVGAANFVRAHPRVGAVDRVSKSRESAPLGVRRMQMTRHDDSQRSDRLAVRVGHLRVVDRVVASIASLPRLGSDGSEMKRHDDSQRSGRWPVMFGDVRVVERVVAPTLSCLAWGDG